METFSALLAFCAGNSPVTGEFPLQRPVTRSFDVFFDLHLWKNGSINNRDLRQHRVHYDVIEMKILTRDTSYLAHEGELWGVSHEFKVSSVFYLIH